jgi:hypothetical protein
LACIKHWVVAGMQINSNARSSVSSKMCIHFASFFGSFLKFFCKCTDDRCQGLNYFHVAAHQTCARGYQSLALFKHYLVFINNRYEFGKQLDDIDRIVV